MSKDRKRPEKKAQRAKLPAAKGRKRLPRMRGSDLSVDLVSILSIGHACRGCAKGETCCCSRYEVCVTAAEIDRIIPVLPEVVKLCPHLGTDEGYDNVFEHVGPGLYAIDTADDGTCVFAFVADHKIRCSLHTVGSTLGLPLGKVKPKACLLWPMSYSGGDEVLSLTDDALSFSCNSRRRKRSRRLCSAFVEAIELVYGGGFGTMVKNAADKGARRTTLSRRR